MSGMKIHITGVSGNIVQVGWAGADPSCVLLSPLRFIWQFCFCSNVSLFELMLGVPVCRDVAFILLDLHVYPKLRRHDIQKSLQI